MSELHREDKHAPGTWRWMTITMPIGLSDTRFWESAARCVNATLQVSGGCGGSVVDTYEHNEVCEIDAQVVGSGLQSVATSVSEWANRTRVRIYVKPECMNCCVSWAHVRFWYCQGGAWEDEDEVTKEKYIAHQDRTWVALACLACNTDRQQKEPQIMQYACADMHLIINIGPARRQ